MTLDKFPLDEFQASFSDLHDGIIISSEENFLEGLDEKNIGRKRRLEFSKRSISTITVVILLGI